MTTEYTAAQNRANASLIERARKRANEASEGPWEGHYDEVGMVVVRGPEDEFGSDYFGTFEKGDGWFIATARQDVPDLCDALKQATETNEKLRRELMEWCEAYPPFFPNSSQSVCVACHEVCASEIRALLHEALPADYQESCAMMKDGVAGSGEGR